MLQYGKNGQYFRNKLSDLKWRLWVVLTFKNQYGTLKVCGILNLLFYVTFRFYAMSFFFNLEIWRCRIWYYRLFSKLGWIKYCIIHESEMELKQQIHLRFEFLRCEYEGGCLRIWLRVVWYKGFGRTSSSILSVENSGSRFCKWLYKITSCHFPED